MADALWLQGFAVGLLTLCLFVGGKRKKETKITISTRKKNEHSMQSSSRVHVQKHTPFSACNRTPSPIWLKCRCFQLETSMAAMSKDEDKGGGKDSGKERTSKKKAEQFFDKRRQSIEKKRWDKSHRSEW